MDILILKIILYLVGFIGIMTFTFGIKNLVTANNFYVGSQYKKVFSDISRSKQKKTNIDKELEKEKKREKAERRYTNAANRMGISVPFSASTKYIGIGTLASMLITLIVAALSFTLIPTTGIAPGLMSFVVPLLLTILSWKLVYGLTVKPYALVSSKRKEAEKDIREELALLLSIMKNSKEENIVTIFSTFEKSCTILKVDIQILLQDINVYGTREALTKFGERLDNDIASRFVIAVKSVLDSSVETRGSTLALVEQDILKLIAVEQMKEMKRLTRIMNITIVGIFAVMILVVMYVTFGEVAVGLSEIF